MFGAALSVPVSDVDCCEYLLMLGANPFASNGRLMTAPDLPGRLRALTRSGGNVEGRDADELVETLSGDGRRGPERVLDLMLRTGPYGDGFGTPGHEDGLNLANLEVLVKGEPRCTLQVHPDDAARAGGRRAGGCARR